LIIQRTFTGYHKISTDDPAVEIDQLQDQFDAWSDRRIEQRQCCEADPAGSAGAWSFSVIVPGGF
jgi:hypothetical protein